MIGSYLIVLMLWCGVWYLGYKVSYLARVDRTLRTFLSDKNKGQFRKGMLSEFADNAIMRLIAIERGLIEDKKLVNTHTQNESKDQKLNDEYSKIRAAMIREMSAMGIDPNKRLEKHQLDSLIIKCTKIKARSLENKRKELIAYGVISDKFNEYRIILPVPESEKRHVVAVAVNKSKPISKQEAEKIDEILGPSMTGDLA
jgi:hypothetical protein